jgi:hypothetical protein
VLGSEAFELSPGRSREAGFACWEIDFEEDGVLLSVGNSKASKAKRNEHPNFEQIACLHK